MIRANNQRWAKANPDKLREYRRAYYARYNAINADWHKQYHAAYNKAYWAEHGAEILAKRKKDAEEAKS